jgi:hypothetical protein
MQDSELQTHLEAIESVGFTILENVLPPERVEAVLLKVREIERETLRPLAPGEKEEDSSFFRTAGLLRLDPLFWDIPIASDVNRVVEGVLGADYLLSTFSGIDLKPRGGNVQPLHPDASAAPACGRSRPSTRPPVGPGCCREATRSPWTCCGAKTPRDSARRSSRTSPPGAC